MPEAASSSISPACAHITIERERPAAAEAKREQSGEIEQVGLVAWLSKMRARPVVGDELDRAESVGQVDGENCNEQHDDHGHRGERHKSPAEDKQSADHLDENRRPAEKEREWHANRVQDANEDVGATGEFSVAMLEKTVADDESKRQREEARRRRKRSEGKPAKCVSKLHAHCFDADRRLLPLLRSPRTQSSPHPRFRFSRA